MVTLGTIDTMLLLEHAQFKPADFLLVMSAADPILALRASEQVRSVDVYDFSFSALLRLDQHIQKRGIANLHLPGTILPTPETYDVALMVVPKGRDYARAQLWTALRSLKPGGKLYIAGPNAGGAKTVIDDAAALFGRCVTLMTRGRSRVAVAVRPSTTAPAYPKDWGDDPTKPQSRAFFTPGGSFTVATMPGIFSWEHLDEGTQFLLENLELLPGLRILDVGCGNGVIGALIASHVDVNEVVMVDDHVLAVMCAQETILLNRLPECIHAQPGDVYEGSPLGTFDLIVSNPPFHQDFDVNTNVAHRIIRGAAEHLKPGGRLVIVANAFLKYDQAMKEHLTHTRVAARNNKFCVLEGRLSK